MSTEGEFLYAAVDLLTLDTPADPIRRLDSSTAPTPFDSALAKLFHASAQDGQLPESIRELLVNEYWQSIVVPDVAQVIAGLELTKAFAAGKAATAKGKKHLRPKSLPRAQNTEAFLVDNTANASGVGVLGHAALAAISEATLFVVLRYRDQDYTFNLAQVARLQHDLQERYERQQRAAQETHDLAVLGGAGSLDDLLAVQLKVTDGLPVKSGKLGQVIVVQTLQCADYFFNPKILSVGELAQLLAPRGDFDGIECNAPYAGDPDCHFGPNFATDCLSGIDPRLAKTCPAAPVNDFAYGHYLSRFFATIKDHQRETISQQLNQARTLRDAFLPGEPHLSRSAIHSILGAKAQRKYPQYFERKLLEGFIARLERALQTRWRVGIY
jgi:hypothetical protein